MHPAAVIGLGNVLLRDEGVGVHVVRRMRARHGDLPGTDLIEGGSAGMKLVHMLAGRRRALLVDCALMGAPPGTLRRFRPGEAVSVKALAGFSLHEGDLLAILRLCRELGDGPEDVTIFGIQPHTVAPGEELSGCLEARLDAYADAVYAFLEPGR
ncbi:MAG: hydrogenase maturation protease [Lentisphaerae bacterium]|nr:hydrogenase maturation protease [Lentisphaerota bacterium]